jgi:vacuolar iron transporter family protein
MHPKNKEHAHFEGLDALEHVVTARIKGKKAGEEIHGAEMPGHLTALADAAKETSLILLILWPILIALHIAGIFWILVVFSAGWLIWKTGRSAILGWARLERMHRVIEEERWEIEHHRPQEREEVRAFYEAKGFSGPLLDEVVDILMADDNRLLEVMLKEELGFNLESLEHPLKQAIGAALGVLISFTVMALSLLFLPPLGTIIAAFLVIASASALAARLEQNDLASAVVWNFSVGALSSGIAYFAVQLVLKR